MLRSRAALLEQPLRSQMVEAPHCRKTGLARCRDRPCRDAVGLALLVVLEPLTPAERVAGHSIHAVSGAHIQRSTPCSTFA